MEAKCKVFFKQEAANRGLNVSRIKTLDSDL